METRPSVMLKHKDMSAGNPGEDISSLMKEGKCGGLWLPVAPCFSLRVPLREDVASPPYNRAVTKST